MKLKTSCFLLICILLSGCGVSYYSSMVATVVDAETMKPIEGAIIMGNWFSPGSALSPGKTYKVVEVVTDKDGKAYIERYFNPLVSEFSLAVYKPGYVTWANDVIFPSYERRKDFSWGDYTFKLERFKPEYSYIKHSMFFNSAIHSSFIVNSRIQKAFREYEGEKVRAERDRRDEIREREEAEKRKK